MKALTKKVSKTDADEGWHSTEYKNMKSPKDLLIEAQNNQLKVVADHRVAVLKSLDELKEFRGQDDYRICLTTIVNAFGPEGIPQTKVREVLPDPIILAKAVKELKDKEIKVEEISARNILFKPLHKPADQQPKERVESVDTNPTGKTEWEAVPASESALKKPTLKPAKPTEDDTQE